MTLNILNKITDFFAHLDFYSLFVFIFNGACKFYIYFKISDRRKRCIIRKHKVNRKFNRPPELKSGYTVFLDHFKDNRKDGNLVWKSLTTSEKQTFRKIAKFRNIYTIQFRNYKDIYASSNLPKHSIEPFVSEKWHKIHAFKIKKIFMNYSRKSLQNTLLEIFPFGVANLIVDFVYRII